MPQGFTQQKFDRSVFIFNTGHAFMALFRGQYIHTVPSLLDNTGQGKHVKIPL
jgi:hypothetical protein